MDGTPATPRWRRICVVACATALIAKATPALVGNAAFETVAFLIERSL